MENDIYEDDSDDFDSDDYDDLNESYSFSDEDEEQNFDKNEDFDDEVFIQQSIPCDIKSTESKSEIPFKKLPVLEIIFYFVCFWSAAFYSLYRFYKTSQSKL